MAKEGLSSAIDKAKGFIGDVKEHWHTPADGNYVPYKEYKDVVIGVGANYTGTKTLEYIGFWSSCFLIMHHYKLPYLTFSVIGLLNMPLGYVSALIWWYVCDNLGFLPKKTERKVYLVYGLMMIFGISSLIFDYSRLFDQSSSFITMLNSFEGMNATACFKTFGTHFLYTGWVGARNIFWRKKLIPKYGRYKYLLPRKRVDGKERSSKRGALSFRILSFQRLGQKPHLTDAIAGIIGHLTASGLSRRYLSLNAFQTHMVLCRQRVRKTALGKACHAQHALQQIRAPLGKMLTEPNVSHLASVAIVL